MKVIRGLLTLGIMTLNLYATPDWYYKLHHKGPSFYVGYGQGSCEADAKKAALNDISSQISVIIDSSISTDMGVQKGESYRNIQDKSSLRSYAQIHGYTVEKLEVEEGQYFIALSYENIPSIDKFNRKLLSIAVPKEERLNHYLVQTPIAKEVKQKLDFSLKRKDGLWYIHYSNIYQVLDDKDFSHFFATTRNEHLKISTNKPNNVMYDGDEFYFKIDSQEDGFITLFTVYEDGTVAKLMSNIPVTKNKTVNIPDKEFESVLQAGLIEANKETFDLYVAIRSDKKEYFDQFARADEELIQDERYKNFGELIGLMDTAEYVTLKIVTKPR